MAKGGASYCTQLPKGSLSSDDWFTGLEGEPSHRAGITQCLVVAQMLKLLLLYVEIRVSLTDGCHANLQGQGSMCILGPILDQLLHIVCLCRDILVF